MSQSHILMLLSNAYRPDPRVQREAIALVQAGYQVTILCWDRQAELPAKETIDGIHIIRVHDVLSSYGSGWRQLFYLPRFWQQAMALAADLSPDIIHCHDLDTLYVGRVLKQRLGCKLVYDAHEHYPAMMSLYLPSFMTTLLTYLERWLHRSVDGTITASTVLRDKFRISGIQPVITLGNHPDYDVFSNIDESERNHYRKELGISDDQITVAYIGGFSRNRLLEPLIESAALLPDIQLHIWGDGIQRQLIEEASQRHTNIIYHGWAAAAYLPLYFHTADIIYYGLRADYPGAVYNAPNTLSQAMASSRPIIATNVGDLGRIVGETECGLLLDDVQGETVAQAVNQLCSPNLRRLLGQNGQTAARETYNLSVTQQQLVTLYMELLEN